MTLCRCHNLLFFNVTQIQGQMSCLEHHINAAVDKIDEDETKQR